MSASQLIISVIAYQKADGRWIAQCLEHDIVAEAKTETDLHYELLRVLVSHLAISEKLNRQPFEGLPPAPQHFWDMYKGSNYGIIIERTDDIPPFTSPNAKPYHIAPIVKLFESHAPV